MALSPEFGAGFCGNAGLQVHRDGKAWGVYTEIKEVTADADDQLTIVSMCGDVPMRVGMQLPIMMPQSLLIFHLAKLDSTS